MLKWFVSGLLGLVAFGAAAALFIGALWAVSEITTSNQTRLAATFVLGIAFILLVISAIVAAFAALKLTSQQSALGLPEGSIRAIIALVLILVFVVMGIYLFDAVYLAPGVGAAARNNAATQMLAMLGTLVAAIAAFYFGTAAVTTGAAAATAAVGTTRQKPSAVTKGSRLDDSDPGNYVLVGLVNPRGLETSYYFEYGREPAYGKQTPMASAGAGTEEKPLEVKVPRGDVVHLRVVAVNDAGRSYGEDAQVDKVFDESGTDPEPGGGQAAVAEAAAAEAGTAEAEAAVAEGAAAAAAAAAEAAEAEAEAEAAEAEAEAEAAEPSEEPERPA